MCRHLEQHSLRLEEMDPQKQVNLSLLNAMLHSGSDHRSGYGGNGQGSRSALVVSLLEAQEEERKRLSRELHDGLGQILTHLKLQTQQCLAEVQASGKADLLGDSWTAMQGLPKLVSEAMQEVREVCRALRPTMLDDLGLLAAVTSHCRKIMQSCSGMRIEAVFNITEAEIPDAAKTALYRIVQEAITNCIKYADADLIHVSLTKAQNSLLLNIRDNGKGFDVKMLSTKGLGLISMRERAQSLLGAFDIESAPLRGTEVRVTIPLSRQRLS